MFTNYPKHLQQLRAAVVKIRYNQFRDSIRLSEKIGGHDPNKNVVSAIRTRCERNNAFTAIGSRKVNGSFFLHNLQLLTARSPIN